MWRRRLGRSAGLCALTLAGAFGLAATSEAGIACGVVGKVLVGTASTSDLRLNGADSDQCLISDVSPHGGQNGNTSGFDNQGAFGTGWQLIAGYGSALDKGPKTIDGVSFIVDFVRDTSKNGTWTITPSQSVTMDLVFAMHAGGRSGAFLFGDESLPVGAGSAGTWQIKWLNNGKQVPDYSNLVIFGRNVQPTVNVPDGGSTLARLGFVLLGGAALRRRFS